MARKNIKADDALEYGLELEVAPYAPKEVTADKYGRYVGQNGTTVDDLEMVGTGEYINVTDWSKMGNGYSIVTNPYQTASPEMISQRQSASQKSTGNNDLSLMNDEAYNQILQYQQDWADANASGDQAAMDAAHAAAEAVRAKYGYSGGADGSEHLGLMAYTGDLSDYDSSSGRGSGSGGSSGYSYDPYLSKYQSRIDALADAILNREAFSYNKDEDPLYQQYKESYTRGGQRGMQDTLAQVSARTGGLASSYAQSAAQQTYNNYMAQLADKVPELYQLAYSMYQDDLANQRSDLSMLQGLDDTAYGRYIDTRDFDYGIYRDEVGDSQWQQQFDYNAQQDALAQQNWQTQWDYETQQTANNTAYDRAMALLLQGINPGDSMLSTAGIDSSVAGALLDANKQPAATTQPVGGTVSNDDGEESSVIDNTEGLAWLREMEKDGASVQELYDMLEQLYQNGLITKEAYNRRLDRYRVN